MTTLTKLTKSNKLIIKLLFLLKAFPLFILLSIFLLALPKKSQATVLHSTISETFNKLHQCNKKFEYDIYFFNRKVGYLHRTIKWDNSNAAAKATVISYGEVSFLWIDSTYQQQSKMQYSPQYNYFLTLSFSQKLTGIKKREMTAEISSDGLSSKVTLNTELSHYQQQQQDENENQALYDLDTLGAQIRLNLLQGKTRFTLSRQASSKVETYQFEVAGDEVITHEKWGKLATTKVVEVGEHDSIVLWFSSKHDHQLIKAELDMMFSPVVWLSHFSQQCHS